MHAWFSHSSSEAAEKHTLEVAMEHYESNDYAEKEIELVEEAYVYLTSKKYPNGCSDNRKRIIRKKSQKFLIENGELFYKQKQKGMVR